MSNRKASIKETGEELSPEDWARFETAVRQARAERSHAQPGRRAHLEECLTLEQMIASEAERRV